MNVLVMLPLPCQHGPSCVMGDFRCDVVILSNFLAGLRVHSVEGNVKRTITTSCGDSKKEHEKSEVFMSAGSPRSKEGSDFGSVLFLCFQPNF